MLEIDDIQDFTTTLNKTKVIIMDAHATWCGPCQWIAPKYKFLDENYGSSKYGADQVQFIKVDVDKARTIATQCRISAMPTFIIFVNGQEVDRLSGANYKSLKLKIEQVLKRELTFSDANSGFKPIENDPHESDSMGAVLGGLNMPTILLLVLLLGYLWVHLFGQS